MATYARIVGWGMYAPANVLTNHDLEKMVDTSDEWIRSRTGIRERRIATETDTTASMAEHAAREALDRSRILPSAVDLIIVATVTPDHAFPATACLLQNALGAKHAAAFDLSAGCTGFIYGLAMANSMIQAGHAQVAVVIGAETLSRITNWEDRSTCVLFGDGAGAVVLQASEEPGGILSVVLGADGAGGEHLILPAGGSKMPASLQTIARRQHFIHMNGPEVFRFATRVMGKAARQACEQAGIALDDINLFIPHQANARIIKSAAKYLKLNPDHVFQNLERYGNTSSASIPIALCEALEEGRIHNNDNLVLVGFGAGLTWGATVIKWGLPVPYQKRQRWYRALRWLYYRWVRLASKVGWAILKLEDRLASRRQPPPTLPPSEDAETPSPAAPPPPEARRNGHQPPTTTPASKPEAETMREGTPE
ncbi:MAG: ketoacyl-ACP synthase III [Caldilineae bacterium]|nr:MAG: ketoacyl-ACP synthase III [Caldilineae bacterium]